MAELIQSIAVVLAINSLFTVGLFYWAFRLTNNIDRQTNWLNKQLYLVGRDIVKDDDRVPTLTNPVIDRDSGHVVLEDPWMDSEKEQMFDEKEHFSLLEINDMQQKVEKLQ